MNSDIPYLEKIDSGRICPECGAHLYEQKAFGRLIIPMMCECELNRRRKEREEFERRKAEARLKELRHKSGIPAKQRNQTFENFFPRKGTKNILSVSKKYADDFPNVEKGLLFIGKYGSGKTHLATAIANTVLDKGYSVKWVTAKEIYDKVRDTFTSYDVSEDDVLRPYKRCKLLIIDDIGTTPPTEYAKSVFHSIIDYRMNYQRFTIMTSNLNLDSLRKKLDERTVDRIPEGFETYTWTAASYRHKENREESNK